MSCVERTIQVKKEHTSSGHSGQHSVRSGAGGGHQSQYRDLLIMILISFASMYALMYAMVNAFANVYGNLNQVYMAGLMAAPMGLIELFVMRAMYRDRRLNVIAVSASLLVLIACWTMIRQQTAISDKQFLRSMIPHHASAILMCREAPIADAEIRSLCSQIITSQQSEIDQMKAMLAR